MCSPPALRPCKSPCCPAPCSTGSMSAASTRSSRPRRCCAHHADVVHRAPTSVAAASASRASPDMLLILLPSQPRWTMHASDACAMRPTCPRPCMHAPQPFSTWRSSDNTSADDLKGHDIALSRGPSKLLTLTQIENHEFCLLYTSPSPRD